MQRAELLAFEAACRAKLTQPSDSYAEFLRGLSGCEELIHARIVAAAAMNIKIRLPPDRPAA